MRISPMVRSIDIVLLVMLIGIVAWTFKVKHESQQALQRVSELEKQIAAEKIEIDLLKSDWSLLNNPARLQQLVERYSRELELAPVEATQMADENALPPVRIPDFGIKDDDGDVAGIDHDATTAGIPIPVPSSRKNRR